MSSPRWGAISLSPRCSPSTLHSRADMGSSTSSKVQYISPDEVAQLVLATPKRDDYLIIGTVVATSSSLIVHESSLAHVTDVRSSDFVGGNIPGALNLTTREFGSEQRLSVLLRVLLSIRSGNADFTREETVSNSTIATHIAPRVPPLNLVILHCMRSQTRGPYAAHLLAQSPALPSGVQIRVMKGGFQGWWRQFKGRGELFENLEGREEEAGEWEQGVLAPEGSRREADDSRRLREQGR